MMKVSIRRSALSHHFLNSYRQVIVLPNADARGVCFRIYSRENHVDRWPRSSSNCSTVSSILAERGLSRHFELVLAQRGIFTICADCL